MYPLAMNRSIEDAITVYGQDEETIAREEGYVNGHEFYSRLSEVPVEVPKKRGKRG